VILSSSNPGDIVLDPFFGSGTTGAMAKKLHRNWIGIEKEEKYISLALDRINAVVSPPLETVIISDRRREARIPFGALLEAGLLEPGQILWLLDDETVTATVRADGKIICNGIAGSIHSIAKNICGGTPVNGWDVWCYQNKTGKKMIIDELRRKIQHENRTDH
jgi:DNA methylase/Restriction Enzyme Adenine Methylase Associated